MALNKYTTSSRFTDTTSNDEGNGSTAKERNAAKYKEYQASIRSIRQGYQREIDLLLLRKRKLGY